MENPVEEDEELKMTEESDSKIIQEENSRESSSNIQNLIDYNESSTALAKELKLARKSILKKRIPRRDQQDIVEEATSKTPVANTDIKIGENGDEIVSEVTNDTTQEDGISKKEEEKKEDDRLVQYRELDLLKDNNYWNDESRNDFEAMKNKFKKELQRNPKIKDQYDYEYDLGKLKKEKKKVKKRRQRLNFDKVVRMKERDPRRLKELQKFKRQNIQNDKEKNRANRRQVTFMKAKKKEMIRNKVIKK